MNSLEVRHWRSNIFLYHNDTRTIKDYYFFFISWILFSKETKKSILLTSSRSAQSRFYVKRNIFRVYSWRNDLVKCFKIFYIFGIGTPKYILHMVLASIWGKNELARNEKKDLGFCILKIWQNLNHFTRSFPHA